MKHNLLLTIVFSTLQAAIYSSLASADVEFVIQNVDQPGVGFNDPTTVSPVGGNSGTSLGEQRMIALEYTTSIYAKYIESDVPIVIQASFSGLPCDDTIGAVLGNAAPVTAVSDLESEHANPDIIYPIPLANHLEGRDLSPDEPDITVQFNDRVDGPDCLGDVGWYYGLDGKGGLETDLVTVMLHELGHGLGFIDLVDRDTGEMLLDRADAFSLHIFDNYLGKLWVDMTNAERLTSFTHVRDLVWNGRYVTAYAPEYLDLGSPIIEVSPHFTDFSGIVSEAGFGPKVSFEQVTAQLTDGSPSDGCSLMNPVQGKVVLLYTGQCPYEQMAYNAELAGASCLLIAGRYLADSPPPFLENYAYVQNIQIPTLSITLDDAAVLQGALDNDQTITITISTDPTVMVGADLEGRVYLYASNPTVVSSITHWDWLARKSLLMEPEDTNREDPHDVDLTPHLLRDMGWNTVCGNGEIERGEECDEGSNNSDVTPNSCRSTCKSPACGDGVVDDEEECDEGINNSDEQPDVCRSNCKQPYCGDGQKDSNEECDYADDSTSASDGSCRKDCTSPICGDGIVDSEEQCDSGPLNSDIEVDACRKNCLNPWCGDGVIDSNERCDPGENGSNEDCTNDCQLISLDSLYPQVVPNQKLDSPEDAAVEEEPKGNDGAVDEDGDGDGDGDSDSDSDSDSDGGCGCHIFRMNRQADRSALITILLLVCGVINRRRWMR